MTTALATPLEFSVADHGPGFDLRSVERGSGLRNLADRIEAVGGSLDVRSEPGQGTTITGRVPAQTGRANLSRSTMAARSDVVGQQLP